MPLPPGLDAPSGGVRAAALGDVLRRTTLAAEPAAILETLTRWVVEVLGDLAIARTLSADGTRLEPGAVAHRDPATEAVVARATVTRHLADEPGTVEVLATRQTRLGQEARSWLPPDASSRRYVRSPAFGSSIVAPLRARDGAVGVLEVYRRRDGDAFDADDLALVDAAATHVGALLDTGFELARARTHALTLAHLDIAVAAVDRAGRITSLNPAAERMFGWREVEVVGRSLRAVLSAESAQRTGQAYAAVTGEGRFAGEWRLRRRDGERFVGHVTARRVLDDGGRFAGAVTIFQDVSERLRLIGQLERRAAQQSAVAELGERALEAQEPDVLIASAVDAVRRTLAVEIAAVFVLDDEQRELRLLAGAGFDASVGQGATVPAGWQDCQEGFTLINREPVIVDDARRERRFAQAPLLEREGVRSGVTVVVRGRRGPYAVLSAHSAEPGTFGPDDIAFLQSMANVLGDALDRHHTDEEIRRRAMHDPLTGLPNRALVMDRLAHAAGRLGRSGLHVALVFLDLDHFKLINDNLGHRAGDDVLREVADRLLAAVRPGDTVGRFGGDEFVVLCEDVEGEAMALAIAQRLQEAFAAPFSAGGDEHRLGASMGVALLQGAQEADALLRDADAAMYRAKERGRERVELFDTGMRDQAQGRLHIEAGLRRAVAGDEIELHYQPIVSLDDGTIAAVEALVRWRDPRRGLLVPGTFMAIAEDSGLVVALGRRTLELACAEAARWSALRPGRRPLPVHVNLSARQLVDQGLPEAIEALLAAGGMSASALALEITEPVLADRRPGRQATFERLRGLGVGLILDDFGTGSSSLGHLGELPVDGLKIDRSFVAGLARGQTPVVDAILRLARAFSLPVIAEGVEDTRQLLALRRLGCALGQGHFFSAALTAEALLPLVAADEPPFG